MRASYKYLKMEDSKNKEFRNRGLNFDRAEYKIVDKNTFIPHLRSNLQTSIPNELLNNFDFNTQKDAVGLFKIKTKNSEFLRIKKLSKLSNSLGISLKAEKKLKDIQIEILDIKDVNELLKRTESGNDKIEIKSILPKYTKYCSWPSENSQNIAPIYLFEYNSKVIAHISMNKKEMIFEKDFELDELACSALGLYFAEGGKVAASFTNSSPKIINIILNFIEKVSNIKRGDLRAAINCNVNQKNKKQNLEDFWRTQTGIEKFYDSLHLSKNVKSPNGILELTFNNKLLKEFMCGLFNLVFANKNIDSLNILRGLLSGDGSPIQQTINTITHHIASDKKHIEFQRKFIDAISKDKVSTIRTINDNKIVLYNDWQTNLNFLFLDPYKFNIINRKKFADRFLNLPATKIFLELKDKETVRGTDVKRRYLQAMERRGDIILNPISPKPNRKYEIILTEKGIEKQNKLKKFIENVYPVYLKEINEFNKTLEKFNLL